MLVIVENPYNHRRYKLVPYESGGCYKLYETPLPGALNKQGEPVKAEWLFTGKYPLTIDRGLDMIWKRMLCDDGDAREIELKDLGKQIKKMRTEVIKTITVEDLP